METGIDDEDEILASETEAQRLARIERERAAIERGEAQARAGLCIELSLVEAWLDALDTTPDAPMPPPSGIKYQF